MMKKFVNIYCSEKVVSLREHILTDFYNEKYGGEARPADKKKLTDVFKN